MNLYVNLPVRNLARSRAFFEALGFLFDDRFCDDTALGMTIGETGFAMLLAREKFEGFLPGRRINPDGTSEVLIGLQLPDRAGVDAMVAAATASGGAVVRGPVDYGFMYEHDFADPDGHVWKPFWIDTQAMEPPL